MKEKDYQELKNEDLQQLANDFAKGLEQQIMKAFGFPEQVEVQSSLSARSLKNTIDEFKEKFPPPPRIIYTRRIRLRFLKNKHYGNNKCFKLRMKFINKYKFKYYDKAIFLKNENIIVAPEWFESKLELLK